jgi:hypothetical protein
MNKISVLAAGVSAAVLGAAAFAAAPAKKAESKAPPPIATYWMDVSTTSGFGAGMMGGGRPNMSQVMAMMNGGGGTVAHSLELRLSSREKPTGAPEAQHFIPAGLDMGASLPLITPQMMRTPETSGSGTGSYDKPKGRMLIYWGCGEHAAAGEPQVIDFARMSEGQMPENLRALSKMAQMMGRMAAREPTAENSASFGEWPNQRDSRAVPAAGSLIGAHRIEANYAPPIAFSLSQGQDFMPGLGLHDAGTMPSGADNLMWQQAAPATGYALALFGQGRGGDIVIWTSARSASLAPAFDYLAPSEVKHLIATGAVLPPSTSQCTLPAEVASAVPQGMVMGIGYGPEAYFSDSPRAPKWGVRVRYKTTAMLMRGVSGMMGDDGGQASDHPQAQPQPPKRRGGLLGGILSSIPH